MKKLILLFLLAPFVLFAQSEFVNVQLPFDCEDYTLEGKKIDILPNGNYFLLAQLTYSAGSFPCSIILDPWGNTINAQHYSEGYTAFSYAINEDDELVYISGWETDQGNPSLYLNAVDYDGNLNWEEDIDIDNANRHVAPKIEYMNGEVYIHSSVIPSGAVGFQDDMWIWLFDNNGNLTNVARYCTGGSCAGVDEEIIGMDLYQSQDIITCGWKNGPWESILHEYDAGLGTIRFVTAPMQVPLRDVIVHSSGNIVTGGEDRAFGVTRNILTMRDPNTPNFDQVWAIEFTVNGQEMIIRDILESSDGDIIVTGDVDNGTEEVYILYFDPLGTYLSGKQHVPSTNAATKYYGALNNNALVGFVDVEYTRAGNTYNTVESFVANQGSIPCVFEQINFTSNDIGISFTQDNLYDALPEIMEQMMYDVAQISLIEKNVCHPCDPDAPVFAKTAPSNTPTAEAKQEVLEYIENDIKEAEADFTSLISPNPVKDEFLIDLSSFGEQSLEIVIFNIKGEQVYQSNIQGGQQSKLNIELNTGIYLIQVDGKSFGKVMFE